MTPKLVSITEKQIRKAHELENIFKKFERSGLPVKKFCDVNNIPRDKFYYWKPRYDDKGIAGLIDQRKGTIHKITDKERKFIQETKIKEPYKSGADIADDIYKRFGKKVSSSQINRVTNDMCLNDSVGRKPGKILKKLLRVFNNVIAGYGLVFGAMNALDGEKIILDTTLQSLENISDNKLLENSSFRLHKHRTSTLLRYIRTLFLLPLLDMKRPIDLTGYEGKTLGALTTYSEEYSGYKTTDRFLRNVTELGISEVLGKELARKYCKTFYGVGFKDGLIIYIDAHMKVVWTSKNIPKGKHGMMDKVVTCLKEFVINGSKGHPLISSTHPGDRHMTKEIFNAISRLEESVGKEIVKLVVYDKEGNSLDILEEFDRLNQNRERKMYPVFLFKQDKYDSEDDFKVRYYENGELRYRSVKEEDYVIYKANKKGEVVSKVALTEIDYKLKENKKRKKNKEVFMVPCALVKTVKDGKLSPVGTLMPYEEIEDPMSIPDIYYARYPNQEAVFRSMINHSNLNVSYGFKKNLVENRTALRKLEDATKSLNHNEKKLGTAKKHLQDVQDKMLQRMEDKQQKLMVFNAKMNDIKNAWESEKDQKQRSKLRNELDSIEREKSAFEDKISDEIMCLEREMLNLTQKKKAFTTIVEKKTNEVEKYKTKYENELLYEIDTEMDHLMLNFKILHENALMFAKERFFPEDCDLGIDLLIRYFFTHYGDIKIYGDPKGELMVFVLNRFDSEEHEKMMENVCKKFNALSIRTADGLLLRAMIKTEG